MSRHHYLPASYLARFSRDETSFPLRDRLLAASSKPKRTCFMSKAAGVGCMRNLYALADENARSSLVDDVWANYEKDLPVAIDALIAGSVSDEQWLRVLIPFVGCMLVRGPDFERRLQSRLPTPMPGVMLPTLRGDNANMARLVELQRLLTCVLAANWLVLSVTGPGELVTNDLGYSPYLHNDAQGSRLGMAIPLGKRHILCIIPAMVDKPVLHAMRDRWVPIIEYRQMATTDHDGFNRSIGSFALQQVFAPDCATAMNAIDGQPPRDLGPEPDELGFHPELLRPSFEFTWHRLVASIRRPPSDRERWDFPLDIAGLVAGWHPPPFFPGNLRPFPPALERTDDAICLKFYDPDIYYDLSAFDVLERLGEHQQAIEAAGAALALATTPKLQAHVLMLRGGVWAEMGHHAEAVADLERAIALDPGSAEIRADYGFVLLKCGRSDDALRVVTEAIGMNPELGHPYLNRGVIMADLGDMDAAIQDSTSAIRLLPEGPERAMAYRNRGAQLASKGDHSGAAEDFGLAASMYQQPSERATMLFAQAKAVEQDGRWKYGLRLLRKAVALDPINPSLREGLADMLARQGKTRAAIGQLEVAVAGENPVDSKAELLRKLAVLLSNAGRYDDAIGRFDEGLVLTPHNRQIQFEKGETLLSQGAFAAAEAHFAGMLRDVPEHSGTLNNLGLCQAMQGHYTLALDTYRHALACPDAEPERSKILRNMSMSLAFLERDEEALSALTEAAAIDPPNALRTTLTRARVLQHGGKYEEALTVLPSLPKTLHAFLAPALLATGQPKKALNAIQKGLRTDPSTVELLTLMADLDALAKKTGDIPGLTAAIRLLRQRTPAFDDT